VPEAPDSGDRLSESGDTDPLADTQTSEDSPSTGSSPPSAGKKRVVNTGDVLGRYELVEDIGEGGMATVFRARDRELRREVAIKVLFPHLAKRPEVVRRFQREARAAAGLEHANILRVYDVGGAEADDPPYIVMELIRGHSLLAEIEQRGPMLAEVVACIGALLADALAVAHGAGIIHRDVKPANVMIDPGRRSESGDLHARAGGRLLLADFGVARLETEDSLVTKTGSVLGTPAYMSPEQASGDTATAKSDLYSLGATLYQLATGSLPYTGSTARVIAQIASGALVPAVRRRADVGPDLSRVIDRLMATDPKARPEKASDVAAELRAIAAAGGLGDPKDELAHYFAEPEPFVRDRLPKVVSAVLSAAEKAIADDKLPRAIALADRAAALAPSDERVQALVHEVTEGGKASRRRRVLAIIGAAAVLAGGVTVGAMQLLGGEQVVAADAAIDTRPIDGASSDVTIAVDATSTSDAIVVAMTADAGPSRVRADAGPLVRADARVRDAASTPSDASNTPPDAAPMIAPPPDALVAATGSIIVKNDTWCDVTIDGDPRGRAPTKALRVEVGTHTVTCEQPGTGNQWTKTVDVAAGQTKTVEGAMLGAFAVTLAVDATIDGTSYPRGSVVNLKRGRHELAVGGAKSRFDLSGPCTIRSTPEPGCY
jgi:eukaryotic-like serine/threonine-protein kinase